MIAAVQKVGHLDGVQRHAMVKHPAFVRITFQQQLRAFLETPDDGVHTFGQQRFVFRFFLDRPPRASIKAISPSRNKLCAGCTR